MPPEPLESSRAREAGPPVSRGPYTRTRLSSSPRQRSLEPQPLESRSPAPDSPEPQHPTRAQQEDGRPARLEALLTDLGAQVRRGAPPRREPGRLHPTGLAAVDALLPGGFPAGVISELSGPASSGRTSIALALLAEATEARCELAAVVDPADAFDPPSAEAAGIDVDRVLWVRPGGPLEALRCVERLMETGGIPLVVLDLGPPSPGPPSANATTQPRASLLGEASTGQGLAPRSGRHGRSGRRRPGAGGRTHAAALARPALHHWIRLSRLADVTSTALVVLSRERLTGSQAAFALETQGVLATQGELAEGAEAHARSTWDRPLEITVSLTRARGAPTDRTARLQLAGD